MLMLVLMACSANKASKPETGVEPGIDGASALTYETPPEARNHISPEYPSEARVNGIQGKVILQVEVLKTGKVGKIDVKQSVAGLDEAAVKAVQKVSFSPALSSGKAVDSVVMIPVEFKLQ
jgi:protein TonB